MADRLASTAGNYSLRFFAPEQIDRILREGAKRGRSGSHDAIERILKHEPGLGRAELWRQIRRLKHSFREKLYQRTFWTPEDEQILRKGYEKGWNGKREAVRELLKRHPSWRPHSIWGRAARLGLVGEASKKTRQRSRQPWTEDDDRILLTLAGYKTAEFIAKTLRRSESAVRCRLAVLGKSTRVHLDGYARRTLARQLHMGSRTIQRLIVQGLLEVRDPRVTRKSLEEACKTGRLTASLQDQQPRTKESGTIPHEEDRAVAPSSNSALAAPCDFSKLPRSCRAKRIWADLAGQLGVDTGVIEHLVSVGVLKLYDPRITEKSLTTFCARYGSLIKTDFLDAETRDWLVSSMDLVPRTANAVAHGMEAFRKHARVVRTCTRCGRAIRGNVFFRHKKGCDKILETRRKPEAPAKLAISAPAGSRIESGRCPELRQGSRGPRRAGAASGVDREADETFQPIHEPVFAIGVKKDGEAQDSPAEICGSAQRNGQSVDAEGASVRGGEHNQARLSLFPAIEDDPCPSGAGLANSSIGPSKRRKHVYS